VARDPLEADDREQPSTLQERGAPGAQTLRSPDSDATLQSDSGKQPCFTLLVAHEAGVQHVEVKPGGHVTVGRREGSDVVINKPTASRDHAVFHAGACLEVEDLGSSNGTLVQGRRIAPRVPAPLEDGNVVSIAGVNVYVRRGSVGSAVSQGARASSPPRGGFVLRDPKMQAAYELASRVAGSDLTVLILGETGVGKELLAEHIHQASARSDKPLLRVNCAALSEGILASELFGHEKGSFTGAHAQKIGLFEAAHTGSLFFDEVGELAPETQAKLLRVLESGEVLRVGSHQSRTVDVRVIAATNRDLRALTAGGRFRSDLLYRLNGVSITIPPLRERTDDLIPLAEHFAAQFALKMSMLPPELSNEAKSILLRHSWPGNVRELKNVIERAVLLTTGRVIEPAALHLDPPPDSFPPSSPRDGSIRFAESRPAESPRSYADLRDRSGPKSQRSSSRTSRRADQLRAELARVERDRIMDALRQGGNQAEAAKILGISRRALLYRLDAFGIPRPRKGKK